MSIRFSKLAPLATRHIGCDIRLPLIPLEVARYQLLYSISAPMSSYTTIMTCSQDLELGSLVRRYEESFLIAFLGANISTYIRIREIHIMVHLQDCAIWKEL